MSNAFIRNRNKVLFEALMNPKFHKDKKNFVLKEETTDVGPTGAYSGAEGYVDLPQAPKPSDMPAGTPEQFYTLVKHFGHGLLDMLGVVDPTGAADLLNASWYFYLEDDPLNAFFSLMGAVIPYAFEPIKMSFRTALRLYEIKSVQFIEVIVIIFEQISKVISKEADTIIFPLLKRFFSKSPLGLKMVSFFEKLVKKIPDFSKYLSLEAKSWKGTTKELIEKMFKDTANFFNSIPNKITNIKDKIFTKDVVNNYIKAVTKKTPLQIGLESYFLKSVLDYNQDRYFQEKIQKIIFELDLIHKEIVENLKIQGEKDKLTGQKTIYSDAFRMYMVERAIQLMYIYQACGKDPTVTAIVIKQIFPESGEALKLLQAAQEENIISSDEFKSITNNIFEIEEVQKRSKLSESDKSTLKRKLESFLGNFAKDSMIAKQKAAEIQKAYLIDYNTASKIMSRTNKINN